MTDYEIGKNYYTYTNRGWPHPIGWENLSMSARILWIQRAKLVLKLEESIREVKNDNSNLGL